MKRGVVLEEEALQEYCKTYNLDFHDVQFPGFTRHPRLEYVGGVPDGIYFIGGESVLIEVKCPSKFTPDDTVPTFYENQIQVYLHIFGIKKGYYVEYIQGSGVKVLEVIRNDTWWKWVLPIIKSFWEEVEYWRENDIENSPLYPHKNMFKAVENKN